MIGGSALFIPANRSDLVAKVERFAPDIVILDLEDGLSPSERPQARELLKEHVATLGASNVQVALRVNEVHSADFHLDLSALPQGVSTLVLPKLEERSQLAQVHDLLPEELEIMAGIESARGVLRAEELLCAPGVSSCYFGAEDLMADVGGRRTAEGLEVLYARSHVALCAAAAGITAFDQIVADFGDTEAFQRDAEFGRDLGYAGKICIHPAQVSITKAVFSPSEHEIAQARAIVQASQAAGGGVVVVDGRMVDGPMVRSAEGILRRTHS